MKCKYGQPLTCYAEAKFDGLHYRYFACEPYHEAIKRSPMPEEIDCDHAPRGRCRWWWVGDQEYTVVDDQVSLFEEALT